MATVSGTVIDIYGAWAQRLVRVYRKDDGMLVGTAISNATTGAWSITVPTTGTKYFAIEHDDGVDPYADSVALDIAMDGVNGQIAFTDRKGHTVTRNGDTFLSSTKAKSGGVSGYFDGTGDYLSIANASEFNIGSGAATIDLWVNTTLYDTAYTRGLFHKGTGFSLGIYGGCGAFGGYYDSTRIDDGNWHHLRNCVDASNQYSFVDGTLKETRARPTITDNTNAIIIGNYSPLDGNRYFPGYIDMVNYLPGVCRSTSSFTPPTHPRFVSAASENARIYDDLTAV